MSKRRLFNDLGTVIDARRKLQNDAEMERAYWDALETQQMMANARPSDLLGNSRLADYGDLQDANLLSGKGLVIGGCAESGELLTYNGDSSLITMLRAGGGKNLNFIFPTLASIDDRSLIVIDIKDGENAFVSADFRSKKLGHKCIYLNPYNVQGFPNTRINPLQILIDLKLAGKEIDSEYDELAELLIPTPPKASDNDWVYSGARQLISLLLNYLLEDDPNNLNFGWIWNFANSGGEQLGNYFSYMVCSGDETVAARAAMYRDMIENAPKEWSAYRSEITKAISAFKPNSSLELSTRINEFNFADLKKEKYTIYFILPSRKVVTAAKWLAFILNHAIETIAAAKGAYRTTFLMDEWPQIPAIAAILKGVRLYRARGIQFWFFAQSRQSLAQKWTKEEIKEFEGQAAVTIYKNVTEPDVLKDLEYMSGNETILNRNLGHNAGIQQAGNSGLSESSRKVLQVEDILGLGSDQHIIRVSNMPRLIIADTVPYFAIDEWRNNLKDVRMLHQNGGVDRGIDE